MKAELKLLAWETTRRCNLLCKHCRASSGPEAEEGELTTEEALAFIEELSGWARPILILSGGEPLLREDIALLARRGTERGLKVVLATNGTLLDREKARELKEAGVRRVSISLDFPNPEEQDAFRGVEGAFEKALEGMRILQEVGIQVQVNTTLTSHNFRKLPELLKLAEALGAHAHHIFLLVPIGRGKELEDSQLSPTEYEETLLWLFHYAQKSPLEIKPTCAPQYYRIMAQQRAKFKKTPEGLHAFTRGCLGGVGFCFVSSQGEVRPCGYLEVSCGNIRQRPLREIWTGSEVFLRLRNPDLYGGKCGRCGFRYVCGGCRARAHWATGDFMAEEPYCIWEPEDGSNTL